MIRRMKTLSQTHYNFLLLVILAIYFRLMTLLLFQPGGFISEWSMYHHFLGIAHVTDYGLYPFIDYWLEYPPLFPWLFTALYRLSLAIPPWWYEQLWFTVFLGLALLPFEIGNLVLVYLIALELYGQDTALRCGWFYASLFVPVYTFVGFFDCLPLFFILLTLWLLLRQRALWAGVTLGIGFMVKVLPVIILPVGLRSLRGLSRKARYLVISGIVVGLLSLPFLWLNADLFFTSFRSALGRSSWETLWAVLEGYYDFGVIGGDRMDPLVTDFSVHPSTLPWLWISLAFALVGLWVYTWPLDSESKSKVVLLAALTLNLFTLYSKGYSPQFLVYILPFVVILLPNLRGVIYCLLLSLVNFIEYPVYFVLLFGERWIMVLVVVLRALLLLALCVEYGFLFFPRLASSTGKLWRQVSALAMIVLLLGGCPVSYRMTQAYYDNRYADEEYRPTIGFLRTQVPPPPQPSPKVKGGGSEGEAALVFTEQPLYYRFYPFLRKDLSVYAVKEADKRLAEIAAKHNEIWLLCGPEANSSVEAWLDDRRHRLANYRFGDGSSGSLSLFRYSAQFDETMPLWIAELDGKIRLLSYRLDTSQVKVGGEVRLTLYWQALREMDESYTVFTHLVDDANQLWGQKDNLPASGTFPTSEWRESEVVEDHYLIPVQTDAPQGTYRLIIGMYDPQTMQRLPVLDKEGQVQGDSVLLEERVSINR